MRIIFNLFKAALHLGVAGVLGYYNYTYNQQGPYNGSLALGTSVCFLLVGMSLVLTWRKKERKLVEHVFEALSSSVMSTAAKSAECPVGTDRVETSTASTTSDEASSSPEPVKS